MKVNPNDSLFGISDERGEEMITGVRKIIGEELDKDHFNNAEVLSNIFNEVKVYTPIEQYLLGIMAAKAIDKVHSKAALAHIANHLAEEMMEPKKAD